MTLLNGKRAVVTGGTSGIGDAIVRRFAAEGAEGVALDLPTTAEGWEPPAGWRTAPVDVRDEDAIARALAGVDGIDVLVAAAGVVPPWTSIADLDLAEYDHVMAVNARGVAATLKHAAPRLRDGGAVVIIGSLNSWRGDPHIATYVASKHAVLGITRSVAMELGARGIRVNAVAPGPIATDALLARMRSRAEAGLGPEVEQALEQAAAQTALRRIATVEDVANAALFLASDLAGGTTGHLLPVDGGLA
ncbi:MAG: SDR family oxidoreductase [Solirubrobacteraceae bacterium]|nr:SDR family oxidoreductase [Solirubrobacteraceae bacterium]